MDADEHTEQVRQRALHLAAEVAETDDSNVPVLLLQLKGNLLIINLYKTWDMDEVILKVLLFCMWDGLVGVWCVCWLEEWGGGRGGVEAINSTIAIHMKTNTEKKKTESPT